MTCGKFVTRFALMALALIALIGFSGPYALAENNGKITGKLVGPDDKPLPDMPIRVLVPLTGEKPGEADPKYTAKTDKEGKFTIENVVPGSYRIFAGIPGKAQTKANVTVEAGKETKLDLKIYKIKS